MAEPKSFPQFAVIGASPAGFTFALSLLQRDSTVRPCDIHIYETNAAGRRPGGPFSLTPNALRILSQLKVGEAATSIYDLVKDLGYHQGHHTIRDDSGKFLGSLPMGNERRWGFDALRIERGEVLRVLEAEVRRLGIRVSYETSLREVIREDGEGVEFVVRRGGHDSTVLETLHAKHLIGADGVHSRTRSFVCGREVKPQYSGNFMSAAYIPTSSLSWGSEFAESKSKDEYSLSITGSQGTLLLIPANVDASVMQVGRQWAGPERNRDDWEALAQDKTTLRDLFQRDAKHWSELPRSVLLAIRPEDIWGIWPFYALPKLDRWVSEQGRVILIGDAAHTVVPAAAQGATQATEDAWTLAGAFSLAGLNEKSAVRDWERQRMARLEKISELSIQLMNVRLPPVEQARLGPGLIFDLTGDRQEREERLDWLYAH